MASLSRRASFSNSTPSRHSSQLLDASRDGRALQVENLLNGLRDGSVDDLDINARGRGQMTPLLFAAEGNHESVLKFLLAEDLLDVNCQDELGRTALIISAQKGLENVTRMLQERDANTLLVAQGGFTPLHVAAWHGHTEVVNLLVGIADEPLDDGYRSLLSPASRLRKVMKGGSFLFCKDTASHHGPRFKAFRRSQRPDGGEDSVSSLSVDKSLKSSTNSKQNSDHKDTALPTANSLNCQTFEHSTQKLLEAKTSTEHLTALHLAAGNNHLRVVQALIQAYGQAVGIRDCLANVREKGGDDALEKVILSTVRILNSHGDENISEEARKKVLSKALNSILATQGDDLSSSLSWASLDAMVSYLNGKDCIGRTPLHHAVWGLHLGVIERLVDSFVVNVNAADVDGFTPLHLTARKGAEDVTKLLLAQDSKMQTMLGPNTKARQNRATRARIVELKRAQQKLGAVLPANALQDSVFAEERNGMTALHYAMEGKYENVVAALAAQEDIDVFSVASPSSPASTQELDSDDGDELSQSPITMALSAKNTALLRLLLKSGKRNKIMQDVQELRSNSFKNPNAGERLELAKDYHTRLLRTTVQAVKRDREILEEDLFLELETELTVVLNTLLRKPFGNTLTLLHHASFAGLSKELEFLLTLPDLMSDINTGDTHNQGPLHYAAMEGKTETVKVLINNMQLRPNEEDSYNRTALQIATERRSRDIVALLMGCEDVKSTVEALYRDRTVNDNAVNAILVVAALIASVTFAGWLQPPLGYRNYYNLGPAHGDPPGSPEAYAAVEQVGSVLTFWVFNSLSFFFAMGTVISGTAEVLPIRDAFIGQEVRMVRGGLVRTSLLLILSIIFVLVAFAAAGHASLPPIERYQKVMWWTTFSGSSICITMLFIFWSRLGHMLVSATDHQKVKWWRFQESHSHEHGPPRWAKVLWSILKFYNLIPDSYTRFESRRQEEDRSTFKKKIFWFLVKVFKLDKGNWG